MPRLADIAEGGATPPTYTHATAPTGAERPATPRPAKRRFAGIKLTAAELREIVAAYGPFLSLEKAAEIAGLSPLTLKKQVSQGRYANCVKRGKPLRFVTERFVQELFGGARQ